MNTRQIDECYQISKSPMMPNFANTCSNAENDDSILKIKVYYEQYIYSIFFKQIIK